MRKVVVIGAGAAGMMAAISAAEHGAHTVVLEHKDRVGKKILSTGNGRCNFTNLVQTPQCYRSDDPKFPWRVITQFDEKKTVEFFQNIGVYAKNRNGYLYPNSDQAGAVLDSLRMEMERLCVEVHTETEVLEIIPKKNRFVIRTGNGNVTADRVILAAGSKAAPVTGSDGSGYAIAKKMGHRIVPVLPALVQLKCKGKFFQSIAGVRIQGCVSLYVDGDCVCRDTGEIQLTQYGISGIPVFQISRYASRALDKGSRVRASIDFMPSWKEDEAFRLLKKRAVMLKEKPVGELFTGMLNRKLAQVLIKLSGIDPSALCERLGNRQLERILYQLKSYEAIVMSVNPFSNAQVCCGGVDTREVDPDTMESRIRTGLYLAGELLDVDGICGGYNLQFAWSSGWIAGQSAAGIEKPHRK